MDTSKEYITMCDCKEVQWQWNPVDGDWIVYRGRDATNAYPICTDGNYAVEEYAKGKKWLPRQDQIQEMIPRCTCLHPLERLQCILGRLIAFSEDEDDGCSCKFTSMEQLWLAFYMRVKHNKTWDGVNWGVTH